MARRVSQRAAIDEIARVVAEHAGGTVFIGVDGYGGSGKTTFTKRAQRAVPELVAVHIDDFAAPAIPEWDWPRFDTQVVAPLLAGHPARYQRWDWHADRGAEWHDIPTGRPLLIEGVSSTRREVAAPWMLSIWVATPLEVRLDRAVERDGPDLLPMWRDVWLPSEDAYVEREDPLDRVDLIVSGVTDSIAVRVARSADGDVLERDLPSPAIGLWASKLAAQHRGECVLVVAFVGTRAVGSGLLVWTGSRGSNASAQHPGIPAIANVHVPASMQRHGVGTALITAAEQIARAHGHESVSISVACDNPDAARLYLRLGYARTGIVDESRYSWTDAEGVAHPEVEQDELLVKQFVVGN